MTPLAITDPSHQWDIADLWPADAFWNVPADLPQWPIALAVGVVLVILIAKPVCDARKRAKRRNGEE